MSVPAGERIEKLRAEATAGVSLFQSAVQARLADVVVSSLVAFTMTGRPALPRWAARRVVGDGHALSIVRQLLADLLGVLIWMLPDPGATLAAFSVIGHGSASCAQGACKLRASTGRILAHRACICVRRVALNSGEP